MIQYDCKTIACTIIRRNDSTTWIIPIEGSVLRVDGSELDKAFDLLNVVSVERADANKYANHSKASAKAKARNGRWITVNGAPVLVDGDNKVIMGAGGNLPNKTETAYIKTQKSKDKRKQPNEFATDGANVLAVKNWKNKAVMEYHVNKHVKEKKEYPNAETYLARAIELAEKPIGGNILGHTRKDGKSFVRYDKETKEFVVAKTGNRGGIITLYPASDGEAYYNRKKLKDLGSGVNG